MEYKTVESEHVYSSGLPRLDDIGINRFEDGQFTPFEYKWLEWLRFPKRLDPGPKMLHVIEQNIEELHDLITATASVETLLDGSYLWVYGYKNPTW